mmetsp:Transcript_10512/g.27528  ORF Transcript_10512/g.27528 Transcript_10512/m.27528 type:complete len:84 (+) Transcript_10512:16-267(+)
MESVDRGLLSAAMKRDAYLCSCLVQRGGNPSRSIGYQGASALHLAVRPSGRLSIGRDGEDAILDTVKALLAGGGGELTSARRE